MRRFISTLICFLALYPLLATAQSAPLPLARQHPIQVGLFNNGHRISEPTLFTEGDVHAIAVFDTPPLAALEHSPAYFTFYLLQSDERVDVIMEWSALDSYEPLTDSAYAAIDFQPLAVITTHMQDEYGPQCNPATINCDWMPVSIQLPVDYPAGAQDEHLILRWRTASGLNRYVIAPATGQPAIRNGLAIRQHPLQPLADTSQAVCQNQPATLVSTHNDEVIYGTSQRDIIAVYGNGNVVYGRGGNDLICNFGGNAVINGGDGNDELYGSNKAEVLIGAAGNDYIDGGGSNDSLIGGPGDDTLVGGAGSDVCNGNSGRDNAQQCEIASSIEP